VDHPVQAPGNETIAGGKLLRVEEDPGTVIVAEASSKEWKE
jgi:hypothetical protein